MNIIHTVGVLAFLTLTQATAFAGFTGIKPPPIDFPKPPPIPKVPVPNLPKVPVPNPLDEAKKQAARIDELRQQAQRALNDFNRMKEEFDKNRAEFQKLAQQAERGDLNAVEARNRLLKAGGLCSNRADVKKSHDRGLGVVLWAKEFDHLEQQKFAASLGTSVVTANPGPALAYVQQFAVESKGQLLKNLKNAPAQTQRRAQREFEMLLVQGLNAAVNRKAPPAYGFDGIDLKVGLATYNHWVEIRMNQPRLVPTEKILGVQLYRIATDPVTIKTPLPNTFQPYMELVVRGTR
jgi:hypothetical protein